MPAPARTAAFAILLRVEDGSYASDLLRAADLDERDAALASQIVFGVLRFRAQLDYLIEHYSGRTRKLDIEVRTALRIGIFQLRYLEKVPPHAAVNDSVELVRRARKASAGGFVNAVLRRVDRAPVAWPGREVEFSCPEWLLTRWEKHYGTEIAEGIARAALIEPETFVRITAAGTRIQDIGSQSVVPFLRLEEDTSRDHEGPSGTLPVECRHRLLDLCAAPGNKTAQALEARVPVVACDLHLHRLRELKSLNADLVVLDGTKPLPFHAWFDRVLVDAPCSGTGTLGRNPEIKWRLRPEDLADLHARQLALLRNALTVLEPGGRLVYSTCSLEYEENEAVITEALVLGPDAHGGPSPAVLRETMQRVPGRDRGDGFYVAVIESGKPVNG